MSPFLHLPDIILAIMLLLTISAVAIPFARWLGIGPELGLLLSGVILGSSHFLGPTQVARLQEISELGVVFFLFVIGLELDLRKSMVVTPVCVGAGSLAGAGDRLRLDVLLAPVCSLLVVGPAPRAGHCELFDGVGSADPALRRAT